MQIRLVFCLPVIISTSWEREKEGMTWAYVVILGLDGFNWQPRLLRTQICIWASLCSVGSQGSSAWILHLFFWVSCGAGPGNKALPSCFHVVKEPPCTRWRGGVGRGGHVPGQGGTQLKESLRKDFWATLSHTWGLLPSPGWALLFRVLRLCLLVRSHIAGLGAARHPCWDEALAAGFTLQAAGWDGRDPDSAPGQALTWDLFRAVWF